MMRNMILAVLLFSGLACAEVAPKNLHGTLFQYKEAKNMRVAYSDVESARKDCERLGFAVIENYKQGGFLVCRVPQNVTERSLAELAKCESVKWVYPSVKHKAVEERPLY